MQNRLLFILSVVGILAVAAMTAWSQPDEHGRTVADVEGEIRTVLGLESGTRIDPDAVPDELLITLGDAVMESHIGDSERHEWMDRMMGGEGSESLDSAHRWMAYRYLSGGYTGSMGFGMGPGGMMGSGMMGGWGLMGNPDMMYDSIPYGSPEDILRRRYAAGEISRREYRRMLKELE